MRQGNPHVSDVSLREEEVAAGRPRVVLAAGQRRRECRAAAGAGIEALDGPNFGRRLVDEADGAGAGAALGVAGGVLAHQDGSFLLAEAAAADPRGLTHPAPNGPRIVPVSTESAVLPGAAFMERRRRPVHKGRMSQPHRDASASPGRADATAVRRERLSDPSPRSPVPGPRPAPRRPCAASPPRCAAGARRRPRPGCPPPPRGRSRGAARDCSTP